MSELLIHRLSPGGAFKHTDSAQPNIPLRGNNIQIYTEGDQIVLKAPMQTTKYDINEFFIKDGDGPIEPFADADTAIDRLAELDYPGFKRRGSAPTSGVQSVTGYLVDDSDPENPVIGTPPPAITVVANYAALPDPTTVSGKFYWAEASQGVKYIGPLIGGTYRNAGQYYSNGIAWLYQDTPAQATLAQVIAGVVTDRFVAPDTLAGWWSNILSTVILPMLLIFEKYFYKNTTPSAAVTGTTIQTYLSYVKISANDTTDGSYYGIDFLVNKTGTNGTAVVKFWKNTTNSLSGATQIGELTMLSATGWANFHREIQQEGANIRHFAVATGTVNDTSIILSNVALLTPNDVSVDQYYIVSITLTSGLDSAICAKAIAKGIK